MNLAVDSCLRWHAGCSIACVMAMARVTTDHEEIRTWVGQRNGYPARVKGSGSNGDPAILRIDFPGHRSHEPLERISWQEWFETFEDNDLAFLHQDVTSNGELSRFNKLVSRETVRRKAG